MTLNGVMAITLRYFSEFGKPVLQKTICGGIYARVYCIFSACTMSSQRKFTFAISSPDEFLVSFYSRSSSIEDVMVFFFSFCSMDQPEIETIIVCFMLYIGLRKQYCSKPEAAAPVSLCS